MCVLKEPFKVIPSIEFAIITIHFRFLRQVSHIPSRTKTCYGSVDHLECLLPLPPEYWGYRCVHDDVWFMQGWHQTQGFMDVKQVLYHPSHIPSAIRY